MKNILIIFVAISLFLSTAIYTARAQEEKKSTLSVQRENLFDKVMNMYKSDSEGDPKVMPPLRDPFASQLPVEPTVIQEPPTEPPRPIPTPPRLKPPTPDRPQQQPPEPTPTVLPTTSLPNIEISGIIWNTKRPQAIVNDAVVEIGDNLDGITIEDITQDGLSVSIGDQYMKIPYNSVSLNTSSSNRNTPTVQTSPYLPNTQRTLPRLKTKQRKGSGY